MDESKFVAEVGATVDRDYGVTDGRSLCFNLLEMGVVNIHMDIERAAQIVAQHILQA